MLDEHAGSSVGALRHNGFLKGFGIKNRRQADRVRRERRRQHGRLADGDGELPPEEPEHRRRLHDQRAERGGRLDRAEERRQDARAATTIVSVDGGCAGVRNVKAGVIDATSQQYPLLMASLGVSAVVKYAKTGHEGVRLHGHRRQPDREEGRRRASPPRASPTASPTAGASRDSSVPRPGRAAPRPGRGRSDST